MPIYSGGGGVGGITVEEDPSALKMAQNLADLQNASTARTNLGVYSTTEVYSTGETNSAISNALSSYTPPAPTFPVVNPNGSSVSPTRLSLNNGVVVLTDPMTNQIDLDGDTGGWQLGDKFAVATIGFNAYINGNTYNTFNGSSSSHTINQAGVHWVVLAKVDNGMSPAYYYWSVG